MFFDSHCHLDKIDLTDFGDDFGTLMRIIENDGVGGMVCIGVDLESFDTMYEKIAPFERVFCSAGVHPDYQNCAEPSVDDLCELALKNKVVAIGETGLDYLQQHGDLSWQRQRFITHIEAARTCKRPLVIHTREASEDTIRLLRKHRANEVGGVLHCFTDCWEVAEQAIDLGFYISISGIVSFHQAQNVRNMAANVPLEWLLIETDSPWLSPTPYRGKVNYPGRVHRVAETLAEIREESLQTIAQATYANAVKLFNLENAVEREKDAYEIDVHGKIKNTVVT